MFAVSRRAAAGCLHSKGLLRLSFLLHCGHTFRRQRLCRPFVAAMLEVGNGRLCRTWTSPDAGRGSRGSTGVHAWPVTLLLQPPLCAHLLTRRVFTVAAAPAPCACHRMHCPGQSPHALSWPITACTVLANELTEAQPYASSQHASLAEGSQCPGMQIHASVPAAFHMTVFMTSQPSDPRPDPFNPEGGGLDPGSPPVPIPAPSAACLQRELDAFKGLAAVSGPPVFQVSAGPYMPVWGCVWDPVADGLHGSHIACSSTGCRWGQAARPAPFCWQQEYKGEQLCQQELGAWRAVG